MYIIYFSMYICWGLNFFSDDDVGYVDISRWKKIDSRVCGINQSMISQPSSIVLKVLQSKGDVLLHLFPLSS